MGSPNVSFLKASSNSLWFATLIPGSDVWQNTKVGAMDLLSGELNDIVVTQAPPPAPPEMTILHISDSRVVFDPVSVYI